MAGSICVISKAVYGEYAVHDIQTNSGWKGNPYGDAYALVPEDMAEAILATGGFCDITLDETGTEVAGFTAREIPDIPEADVQTYAAEPTELERLRADVDYIALMTGVEL